MIDQRFTLFARRFSVQGATGEEVAQLHGPLFRPWTFRIVKDDQEVGKISKKWSGLFKESFTNADNFGLKLGDAMDHQLRTLALAATFLIDFLYFEN